MKRWALLFSLLSMLVLCLGVSLPVSAQVITGEITGTVTDQSAGAVPGATVTAECPDTKQTRTVTSGAEGEYRLAAMPSCVYKVSVTAQGFKTTVRDIQVVVAQTTKADFQLQVGQRTETITVEAAAPLIDFSPGVNNDVDTQRIVDLPFNARDFKGVLAITPGVQRAPGGGFLDVSISGQRTTANNFLIDGMYNNDRFYGSEVVGQPGVLGVSASLLPPDAIAEFTVQQLPSAEYGVKGGASINATLRSGTNDLHGAAYYFGHWSATDASNAVAQTVTPLHNHQYGVVIGGPIVKDRTFFFGNFEGQKNSSKVPYVVGIPTQGDVNAAMANINCIAGSTATCPIDPVTMMPIIVNTGNVPLNPAGQAMFKYYPIDPSLVAGGANLVVSVPNSSTLSQFIIKIDHKLNDKMQLSGRYLFADSLQSTPATGYDIPPPSAVGPPDLFNTIAPTRVQMVGLTWTYNLSSNMIFDTRFTWTRYSQILDNNNKINPLSLGIDTGPLDPLDYGVPPFYNYATGGNPGGIFGYPLSTRPTQTYDSSEHFTWIKGKHTMKMGGNYQFGSTFSLRNRARTSLNSFESDWTTVLSQLLVGRLEEAARSFGNTARHIYQPSLGVYWQDEWKMRPRLTLSFGLRWELNGALGEGDKIASNFDPVQGLVREGPTFKRLYDLDLKDFGPRAGLAWDIFGNGKTALRVGYSMTYDVASFAAISAPYSFHGARAGAFTNANLGVFSVTADGNALNLFQAFGPNTCYNPAVNTASPDWVCIGPQGGSATPVQTFGASPTSAPPFNIFGTVPKLLTPRIHYYSLTLQHEVFKDSVITVSYIGSKGQNLLLMRSLNLRPFGCYDALNNGQQKGPPGGPGSANDTTLDCSRPFDSVFQTNVGGTLVPSFKYIQQLTNAGSASYNGLQAAFRQRNWHGINTQYSFTWSNCIDNNSTSRGGSTTVPIMENPFIPDSNRGPCDTDVRLNFSAGGTYTVPTFSKLGRFGEGWEIGSIFTALTGRPWTPLGGSDHTGQDQIYQRADCLQKPIYDFANPHGFITNAATAFGTPADGTIGTCGRNSLRGPGLKQWDGNIVKTTKITERFKVQFRWEVFNVLNHANFNPTPSSSQSGSGSFAVVSGTPDGLNPGLGQGGPRGMQFGLKLIF